MMVVARGVGAAWLGASLGLAGCGGDDMEGSGGSGTDTGTVSTTMVPSTVSDPSSGVAPTEGSATGTSATVGSDSMDADTNLTTGGPTSATGTGTGTVSDTTPAGAVVFAATACFAELLACSAGELLSAVFL